MGCISHFPMHATCPTHDFKNLKSGIVVTMLMILTYKRFEVQNL
jgi:hypothetical protein